MTRADGFPLRSGTQADRDAIRACLRTVSFTEAAICERLGVADLHQVERRPLPPESDDGSSNDALDVLVGLFVLDRRIRRTVLEASISDASVAAFCAVDLIRPTDDGGRQVYRSPVRLVPILTSAGELFIASDAAPRGADASPTDADFVFSAHNPLTRQFLDLAPRRSYRSLLDLGTGTGIGALAACNPPAAIGVDITARAVHFARFNAWLNDRPIDVREGDLYAPVAGLCFDCVLAHPPYVPTLKSRATYRDGGETGEQITRRVVEDLHRHLNPRGVFLMPCIAMDTREGRFEDRARQWLGAAVGEFDLIFAVAETRSPAEFARDLATRVSDPLPDEAGQWIERFDRWGVAEVTYGALAARRFDAAAGPPQTRRVKLSDETRFASFEWLFDRFERRRNPAHSASVLASAPRIGAATRLRMVYETRGGRLTASECLFENGGRPFPATVKVDEWVARLVMQCDGRTTVAEIGDRLTQSGGTLTPLELVDLITVFEERCLFEEEALR